MTGNIMLRYTFVISTEQKKKDAFLHSNIHSTILYIIFVIRHVYCSTSVLYNFLFEFVMNFLAVYTRFPT